MLRVLLISVLLMVTGTVQALPERFIEGQDYQVIAPYKEASPKSVRVFFSYNCPHCYRHQPLLDKVEATLADKVDFILNPVGVGRKSWTLSQMAFVIAEQSNRVALIHHDLFKRIHEQRKPFQNLAEVGAFLAAYGIDNSEFTTQSNSEQTKSRMSELDNMARKASIKGVPNLVVNGHYLVNASVNDPEKLSELLIYLIDLDS
ncbi:thiol:disulfide interchange protein DsbA/DsbL [Paraferrimonas haliotis]|uniref:Thiol:disulfide interchange protein n=1 Tax=Paraferrimonas haliotis TaxID=2013866 RepID=A0AA37WY40_9GAMM|nr:thiol:disulfide interchange protein DsbA/DsbL [Paraferrimonas haliotis]GLS82686.1 thiol:disulfide interchange protein [Paraferrimonas haliotis]